MASLARNFGNAGVVTGLAAVASAFFLALAAPVGSIQAETRLEVAAPPVPQGVLAEPAAMPAAPNSKSAAPVAPRTSGPEPMASAAPTPDPAEDGWRPDQIALGVVVALGCIAMAFGAIGLIRREAWLRNGMAMALGAAAIAVQFAFAVAVGAVLVVLLAYARERLGAA
jgi:hypothetical protein